MLYPIELRARMAAGSRWSIHHRADEGDTASAGNPGEIRFALSVLCGERTRRSDAGCFDSPLNPRSPVWKCPREDSNLHAVSGTGPSNQPVYQFQHVGVSPVPARHRRSGKRADRASPRFEPPAPHSPVRPTLIGGISACVLLTRAVSRETCPCSARKRTRTSTGIPPQDPESCASTNSAIRANPHRARGDGEEWS